MKLLRPHRQEQDLLQSLCSFPNNSQFPGCFGYLTSKGVRTLPSVTAPEKGG